MTTAANNTNNANVTDKSIHLLDKCLNHQRYRFEHARLKAHQSALILRAQTQQLEGLNSAINEYRLGQKEWRQEDITNPVVLRKLLLDFRNLQKKQVDREEQVYQCCQEEALSAHRKVKLMEQLLEKLRAKQRKTMIHQDHKTMGNQVFN